MYCTARFAQCDVTFVARRYENGRLALVLQDSDTDEIVAKATVNVPDVQLADDEIIVKNWSENEGMLDFLVVNGLAEYADRIVPVGHVHAHIVKVTHKLRELCGL